MNKKTVARRLDLVGTSTGAVVSVATWCSLHASDADLIFGCVAEKLAAEATEDHVRAGLLYVLHEVVLTCASRGAPEAARRGVLSAIGRHLPQAMEHFVRLNVLRVEKTTTTAAFERVLVWWSMLGLFPAAWLDAMHAKLATLHQEDDQRSRTNHAPPSAVQRAHDALCRYRDAKTQYAHAKRKDAATADAEGCLRHLINLRKAVSSGLDSAPTILAWCDAERAELEGHAPEMRTVEQEQPSNVVKTEKPTEPAEGEDEDVLGSFW
ncbi:hypothetical protein STCU_01901 [Strigomonas culicis]|uniref:CID domain-containing protein n=1 Tax=Strigomonas culicis TaxID=28005 RepID=S9WCR5_9TRYP|nr:hypothetical protein STCU_01901 [Strigomonas culicis]|eukprot:EPY33865.1 hypothetical protein STCU_01901 [Strigomonas culicis]